MVRLTESQTNHDAEVCRLARKYSQLPIWSSCPTVQSTVTLPKMTYESRDYEPDVYLKQVKPERGDTPFDWIFEVETKESIGEPHTEKQLKAFVEYAKRVRTRVIVLVPTEAVEEMKANVQKWGLGNIVEVVAWGWG